LPLKVYSGVGAPWLGSAFFTSSAQEKSVCFVMLYILEVRISELFQFYLEQVVSMLILLWQ